MEMTTGLPRLFRASNSARICSGRKGAAAGLSLAAPRLHLIVTAGLGQQIGKAVAADGAGRLDAIHDGAAGSDEAFYLIPRRSGVLLRDGGQMLSGHALPAVIIGLAHFMITAWVISSRVAG